MGVRKGAKPGFFPLVIRFRNQKFIEKLKLAA